MERELAKSLEEKSAIVDKALEELLRTDAPTPNLDEGVLYALGLDREDPAVRGKRIRPALCLMACEALEGEPEQAVPFAMAVELMHNFFLVHDDIEDGDAFRRGRPSVWKRYGLAHGINIGDFLFTKVFSAFLSEREARLSPELRVSLLALLVDTLERTHIGQAQDMNALASDRFSIEAYMELVTNKTGFYLAAPMIGGALIAGASEETLKAIRELGRCVGPVFQIVDDTIDLTQGKGREAAGSDIREGKRSFLVAHTASNATEEDRRDLFEILDLPRAATGPEQIERARALFERYGAIEAGRALCRELMERAHAAMADTPQRLRRTLLGVFDGLLDRKS